MCTEKMKKIGAENEDEGEEMVKFISNSTDSQTSQIMEHQIS